MELETFKMQIWHFLSTINVVCIFLAICIYQTQQLHGPEEEPGEQEKFICSCAGTVLCRFHHAGLDMFTHGACLPLVPEQESTISHKHKREQSFWKIP